MSSTHTTTWLHGTEREPERHAPEESVVVCYDQWPKRPEAMPELLTPIEAAQYLRLDETAHSPQTAIRTLNYWRDKGELKATKFARRVWFRKTELDRFLERKTEA